MRNMNKSIVVLLGLVLLAACNHTNQKKEENQNLEMWTEKSQVLLEKEGLVFRDLNSNGVVDTYEDASQTIEARIEDLLSQMNLEEKAGIMFINGAPVSKDAKPEGNADLEGPASRMKSVVYNMDTLKIVSRFI
jgi:beta-glucosidase